MILGLAPMDGFTDCATRLITQEIFSKFSKSTNHLKLSVKIFGNHHYKSSEILYLRTEFMTADGYVANPIGVIQHIITTPNQKNVIAQIHGGNHKTLLATVIDINKKYSNYFAGIELNLGCPANNIMKSGGGSALLKDRKKTLKIIKLLSQNSKLPFSIKTRTGLTETDQKEQTKFILEASKYCSMITIHGKTVKQAYTGDSDWQFIYNIKNLLLKKEGITNNEVKSTKYLVPSKKNKTNNLELETIGLRTTCKVIGNGGITSYSDALSKLGNLDGIMIGQAAIGNPRIFTSHQPTLAEKKETIFRHLDLMLACEIYFQELKTFKMPTLKELNDIIKKNLCKSVNLGDCRSIIEFRKHLFQYIKGIPNSREFKVNVSKTTNYNKLKNEINKFFELIS